jgi:hypothetical protein
VRHWNCEEDVLAPCHGFSGTFIGQNQWIPHKKPWEFCKSWDLGMGQNPIPLVNIKIAGKWMFIPLKMVCIGIDP